MSDLDNLTPGEVLAEASVADFISKLGLGIAQAQQALDTNTIDQLAEYLVPRPGLDGKSLLDLGLSPAFYHYQHADISLSMQLSLKVEQEIGVKLNLSGSVNDNSTSSDDASSSESSSSSGSSSTKVVRDAKVEIAAASAGSLTVGDKTHALAGSSPKERIKALQAAVAAGNPDVVPWIIDEPAATVVLLPKDVHADDTDKVVIKNSTVAYVFGGFNSVLARIENDTATTYELNSTTSAAIAGGEGSATAHADALVTEVNTNLAGYSARRLTDSDGALAQTFFDTGKHNFFTNDEDYDKVRSAAQTAQANGLDLEIEGFTDRQLFANASVDESDKRNRELGDKRSVYVKQLLQANGFTGSATMKPSEGDKAASATDSRGQNNQQFRRADIRVPGAGVLVLIERTVSSAATIEDVSPDSGTGNRFLPPTDADETHQFKSASSVEIQGASETYALAARADGGTGVLLDADAVTHAGQLAARINANSADHTANHDGNVVTVFPKTAKFSLTLVSVSTEKFSLSSSEAITVTKEFTRSSTSSITTKRTGNKAVAVAGSLDVGFSRKFETSITGNSSISARLVSLPAPPAFLAVIKDYLED